VGTISVEISELLSRLLTRRGIEHQLLNARYHEKEAQIISRAGQPGAVTIATNMAGRGTDIKLAPQVVHLDRKIVESELTLSDRLPSGETLREYLLAHPSGLQVIGTERHEARRIDNQLRGRAGRQGDPGSSRFFLSLEDDLLRIFGADRMQNLMERLGMEEGVPIEHRLVTRAIKNAQDKVEARNFDMRKHLLEYDDVLNKQREVIYARRRQVLTGADLSEEIMGMAETIAAELVASHCSDTVPPEDWDLKALDDAVFGQFALRLNLPETAAEMERPGAVEELVVEAVHEAYRQREESFTPPVTRHLERALWLQTLDDLWREHLVNMDHLKEGIGLRGYAQKNPLNEYQKEGYELFEEMLGRMEADIVEKMMSVQLQQQAAAARPAVAAAAGGAPATADMPPEIEALERRQRAAQRTRMRLSHAGSGGGTEAARPETVRRDESKVGRNDPCPCGSGKKYKKCHGREA
jgi:preprotein translocase subunit SecA